MVKKEDGLKSILENEKVIIQKKYGYYIINGKYYEFSSKDGSLILKPVDIKKFELKLEKVKKIASKLKHNVDGEKILTETLMANVDYKDVDKLDNMLFHSKRKYKAKTREHHCVDMKIGNMIVPIVD